MNVALDTDDETVCDRCFGDLGPDDVKHVAGLMVGDKNYLVVYCPSCWQRMKELA